MIESDIETANQLAGELVRGERILWQGRPQRQLRAHHVWAFLISVLFNAGFAWFGFEFLLDDLPDSLVGLIFITGIVGIMAIMLLASAVRPILDLFRARRTIYAVTDRRIISLIGGSGTIATSVDHWQIGPISRIELSDGSGTLRISAGLDEVPSSSRFFGPLFEKQETKDHIFEMLDLPDVKAAEQAVRRMSELH